MGAPSGAHRGRTGAALALSAPARPPPAGPPATGAGGAGRALRATPSRRSSTPAPGLLDTVAVLASFVFISVSGLQITELSVPPHVDVRGAATLVCHYNLHNNATLNSVKWYKDEREFFRYIPGMSPETKAFPAQGITLDLSKSYRTQVTLRPLTYNTSGTYRCEVSADAPKFETVHRESNMTVLAEPKERPAIKGADNTYSHGQLLQANCTADRSFPPATLQWLINGKPAERYQMANQICRDRVMRTDKPDRTERVDRPDRPDRPGREESPNPLGLQASSLCLSFVVDRQLHFPSNRLELKCLASIPGMPALSKETTHIAFPDQNQKAAQRSAAAHVAASLGALAALSSLRSFLACS